MNWDVSFGVATACLIVSLILWFLFGHIKRKTKPMVISPFYVFFGGVFLSAVFLLIPIYNAKIAEVDNRGLLVVVASLHHALQMFTVDADPSVAQEVYMYNNNVLGQLYSGLLSIEMIIAPLLTFGFVASFFKTITSYFRYFKSFISEKYIFSELNDKAIALAKSIKEKHPHSTIVFTDVFEKNEEPSFELIQKAKRLNAICFKQDIINISFRFRYPGSKIHLFNIGDDETENINQAVKLINRYKKLKNSYLFLFSTRIESELIINSITEQFTDKENMKVRWINEVQSLIYQNLYSQVAPSKGTKEQGIIRHNIFERARQINTPDRDKNIPISAVILGVGQHGTEMIKALSWFCQMDGYALSIHAFDKDSTAKQRFAMMCPELMDYNHNNIHIPGDAFYNIEITNCTDVESDEFADRLKQIKDVSYVLVCLGNDAENIRTAIMLRLLFERMDERRGKKQPIIQAIVYDSDEIAALKTIKDYAGNPYNIDFIGDLETSHSEEIIINSELQNLGLESHKGWSEGWPDSKKKEHVEKFWKYEYYYRSSCASAIHCLARIRCGIVKDRIGPLEHCRWNAYMRSEGYIYSGSPDKESRNDFAKMHHNLINYRELSKADKPKDNKVARISNLK